MTVGRDFRIDRLSLDVAPGEKVSILGPNGSGKSTLLRAIAGLDVPRAGSISWSGEVLSADGRIRVPPARRGISILFQEGGLFPHLDVGGNVALGLPPELPKEERGEPVHRAMTLAHVEHLRRRSVTALSGGEQQRVALARALVRRPKVLLLDEPFQALDGPTTRSILDELSAIVAAESIATLHVTHDAEEAAALSDRVVLLRDGRKVQEGTFADIYLDPTDPVAASFLGPIDSVARDVAEASGIELPPGSDGTPIYFRPEHLLLSPNDHEAHDGSGRLVVGRTRSHGALQEVTLTLADGSEIVSRRCAEAPLRVGQGVSARIARVIAWPAAKEERT